MQILRVGRTKLYSMFPDGDLDKVRIGSRTFVTTASVNAYVERLIAEGRASRGLPASASASA